MAIDEFIYNIGISEESGNERKKYSALLLLGILAFVLAVLIYFKVI